ncbi:MAG: M23 family metallopeptidase [Eubacteriales bacterium]|jgi:murein DD-endopeptidase MepM/ murein hydrolase activator NlpD
MDNLHLLNNKPKKDNSRGFYIALGVCLIAIGVAAWTTYDSVVNYAAPNEGTVSSEQVQHTNEAVSGIKVYEEASSVPVPVLSSEPAPKVKEEVSKAPVTPPSKVPAKRTEAKVLTFTSPVDKTVTQGFSGQNPVYSKTFKDWRVHTGTDFAAKPGDTVKAAADGTVKDIVSDDFYGNTVVVMHDNIETSYCGLGTIIVRKGEGLKQGQKIGTVGITPFESADASHMHLSMKRDGKYIDPLSVIK